MNKFKAIFAAALLILAQQVPLCAQDEDLFLLSPFEVSADEGQSYQTSETLAGTRIRTTFRDLASSISVNFYPAVTFRQRADFITLRLHLVNDARLSDLRLTEIRATVRGILERADANGRIALQYPRGTITADNFRVNPEDEGNDTAFFDVYLALPLGEKDRADTLTDQLIAFAKSLKVEGRTLIDVGKPGLSVKNPERFRGELLAAIAADMEDVRAAFGPGTRFVCAGIDGRMKVAAVTVDEVELSLPYSFNILSKDFPD